MRRDGTLRADEQAVLHVVGEEDGSAAPGAIEGEHGSDSNGSGLGVHVAIVDAVRDSSRVTRRGPTILSASEAVISTAGLRKRYGRTEALRDLTMDVGPGEAFGFLGPNGAGKTTAVKLLLGLARPTGGGGSVLGRPLGDRDARRRIGYLPELFRYQPWLRGHEVLGLHADLLGLSGGPRRQTVLDDTLGLVGLSDRAGDQVATYSKGMQQRLGLGVALLGDPALVFLDEPTSALDPIGRIDVREIIRTVRARGTSVFLNSHLLTEVELICDRVAIVDHGRVLALGGLDALLGQPEVRIRVTDLPAGPIAQLEVFGTTTVTGEWLTIRPIDTQRVPDVVAAIVLAGGRVHAVDVGRISLEDRFRGLVAAASSGSSGDSPPPSSPTPDQAGSADPQAVPGWPR